MFLACTMITVKISSVNQYNFAHFFLLVSSCMFYLIVWHKKQNYRKCFKNTISKTFDKKNQFSCICFALLAFIHCNLVFKEMIFTIKKISKYKYFKDFLIITKIFKGHKLNI